jgi:hypothetical protein
MPNIFLCIAWPIIIFLTVLAYRLVKEKYSQNIGLIIAAFTCIITIIVCSYAIANWYQMGRADIRDIFANLMFLITPWLPN